jgi:hypothetical protein
MKKFILIYLFFVVQLFGMSAESKIMKLIFESIFQKQVVIVFVDSEQKSDIIKDAGFVVAPSCSKADVIYTSDILEHCAQKPIFTDNYETFKQNRNVFGAFYWTKGRPNIMFDSKRMEVLELILPENLKKYDI